MAIHVCQSSGEGLVTTVSLLLIQVVAESVPKLLSECISSSVASSHTHIQRIRYLCNVKRDLGTCRMNNQKLDIGVEAGVLNAGTHSHASSVAWE